MPTEEENLLALSHSPSEPAPPPGTDLEMVFEEHGGQVFAAAYRVTGNAHDAEDVVQTVFMRLLRRRHEIDLSPGPGAYLHRAAVNAALDLMRSRKRAPAVALDDVEVASGAGSDDPARRHQDREVRGQLRRALLALTPKSAEIFTLRFLEGNTNQDIARTLGMTQTAVAVTLHRARNQVKKELGSYLGGN